MQLAGDSVVTSGGGKISGDSPTAARQSQPDNVMLAETVLSKDVNYKLLKAERLVANQHKRIE